MDSDFKWYAIMLIGISACLAGAASTIAIFSPADNKSPEQICADQKPILLNEYCKALTEKIQNGSK